LYGKVAGFNYTEILFTAIVNLSKLFLHM